MTDSLSSHPFTPAPTPSTQRMAIVGAGSIGIAFAIVFARAGWAVQLTDPDADRRAAALHEIADRLLELDAFTLLDEAPDTIGARVRVQAEIEPAVTDAQLVIECAPERIEIKREIFEQLDAVAPAEAVLASASSALTISSFAEQLAGRRRCLVAHPGNPPYLIPVIEIVPAPFTDEAVTQRACEHFAHAGLKPVRVAKEIEGFLFNRLQGALLREAYCLVRDGVASVEDIDTLVRDGLGLRWSVVGPFETVDLNTRGGIASHAQKMGAAYARMGAQRGQNDPWTPELVVLVDAQRRAQLPIGQWEQRGAWRDRALMALTLHRKTHHQE